MIENKNTPYQNIGFIGLGLIGGSIAKLIKNQFPEASLFAVATKPDTISYAISEGLVDAGTTCLENVPDNLDLIFVCTPIELIAPTINQLSEQLSNDLTITDIGSVKSEICQQVKITKDNQIFIPGHPMAGNEKTGIRNAQGSLLHQATYILVPQQNEKYEKFKQFLSLLDFRILELEPGTHDLLACVASHFPYIMAILTAQASQSISDQDQQLLKQVISSGFRDTTRVAGSSAAWGAEVCGHNKDNILKAIEVTKQNLSTLESLIKQEKTTDLQRLLEETKKLHSDLL
jgi:prephenate dehydrogenase